MWPRTKQAYAEYEERVKEGLEDIECVSTGNEAYASSCGCDICGSWERHTIFDGKGISTKTGEIVELLVCEDCVYYLEYGRLDDVQMSDIESSDI